MTLVIGSLQLGFLYGILALGIYVTFRILNIPDLTAEGSFTLGLAASAVCTLAGHPVAGIVAAAVAGALAGCVTGVLQTKMGIHAVLAGILTMCGLYTINLIVMGSSPNISLINVPTIFKAAESLGLSKEAARLVIAIAAAAVCLVLLILFFRTHLGLCIRATGDNDYYICPFFKRKLLCCSVIKCYNKNVPVVFIFISVGKLIHISSCPGQWQCPSPAAASPS